MMQSRDTNKYPPTLWTAIKRVLAVALREGWKASSINTTLAAASVTKTMPATIVGIFSIGVYPLEPTHNPDVLSSPRLGQCPSTCAPVGVNGTTPRFISEPGCVLVCDRLVRYRKRPKENCPLSVREKSRRTGRPPNHHLMDSVALVAP